jgi:hypothetical protein
MPTRLQQVVIPANAGIQKAKLDAPVTQLRHSLFAAG